MSKHPRAQGDILSAAIWCEHPKGTFKEHICLIGSFKGKSEGQVILATEMRQGLTSKTLSLCSKVLFIRHCLHQLSLRRSCIPEERIATRLLWLEHGDDNVVITLPLLLVIIQVNKGIDKSEQTSRNILARRNVLDRKPIQHSDIS